MVKRTEVRISRPLTDATKRIDAMLAFVEMRDWLVENSPAVKLKYCGIEGENIVWKFGSWDIGDEAATRFDELFDIDLTKRYE